MESPLNVGDTTTNSISHRLDDTHLSTTCSSSINSAMYSGQKMIQLTLVLQTPNSKAEDSIIVLRRVQDSYVNISQLFSILLRSGHFSSSQLNNFLNNEVLTNSQYFENSSSPQFNDCRKHANRGLRGIWIPYDRAISLALKFDLYEFAKELFLVDVHDFDKLSKTNKRPSDEEDDVKDEAMMGSPAKKQKLIKDEPKEENKDDAELIKSISSNNTNFPFTSPPITNYKNQDLISEIRSKLSEIFKKDEENRLSFQEIKSIFQPVLNKCDSPMIDVPLDQQGQTALHFASTLASVNLVSAFIKLGLNSPIRGNLKGESPLITAILVTNSMERGNFAELLKNWLWPNLWLHSSKNWSFLHYLSSDSGKKFESSKFYLIKILEYIISNEKDLFTLVSKLINLQDDENGNTCLHLAAENGSKWFIKILLELKAEVNIPNKMGIKPIDFDIVKDSMKNNEEFENEHIFELVRTSVEFLNKRMEVDGGIEEDEEPQSIKTASNSYGNLSNKIFQSIQDLLSNTNIEYDTIINSKKEQIKQIEKSLHDSTIITANNRFISKKISEKLVYLDNLKLQMTNISDKLQLSRREIPNNEQDEDREINADEPFIIKSLYEKLHKNESVEDLKSNGEFLNSLPSVPILKARLKAYKKINNKIENELNNLLDYSELTSKFKKVVSICTGVDINEVDELLDGLLEAVEGQQ